MNINTNTHIEEFLKYYISHSADYAVLVTGDWGSGKTYFIRNFLDKPLENDISSEKYPYVYVSLFGVKSREEIDERLFEKLNPNDNLKKSALKLTRELISTIPKLGGVTNAGIDVAINFRKLKKDVKKNKFFAIVFDDIERADLSVPELLGYINELVERQHISIILIAEHEKWKEANEWRE